MKKILANKKILIGMIVFLILIVVGVILLLTLNKKSYRNVIAESSEGGVTLQRGEAETISVEKDMRFLTEDQVTVEGASALTMLADEDKHIYARENTVFKMETKGNPKKGRIAIHLVSGQTLIEIENKLAEQDAFEVQSPNASISVRGTTFLVDYNPATFTTRVEVKEGTVEVSAKNGDTLLLHDGESAIITDTTTAVSALTDRDIQKDFDEVLLDEASVVPATLPDVYPGDVVSFGEYQGQPIEWIVVERDGEEAVLLSKDVLFEQSYNAEEGGTTWEESSLRSYLNQDFYEEAFIKSEQKIIVPSQLVNLDSPIYGANGIGDWTVPADSPMYPAGGNPTEDCVYLLSAEDVEHYFHITPADFNGADYGLSGGIPWEEYAERCNRMSAGILKATDLNGNAHGWWLRTPGSMCTGAAQVLEDGAPFYYSAGAVSCDVSYPNGGVRPAIRVKVEGDGSNGPLVVELEKEYASYVEAYNAVLDRCIPWLNENTEYTLAEDSVKEVTYALYDFNLDGSMEMGIELKDSSENYGKWGGDRLLFFVVGYDEVLGIPVCYLSANNGLYYTQVYQGKLLWVSVSNLDGTVSVALRAVTPSGYGEYEKVWEGKGNNPYRSDGSFSDIPISDRSLIY